MNNIKSICAIIIFSVLISIAGCATMPGFMDRSYTIQKKARQSGFNKEYVKTGIFTLMTYQRFKASSEKIRIYIEGDGRAWETRNRLSDDPTPSNPIALKLALTDPSDNVAYIARPGQFPAMDSSVCDPTYWSQRRFAPEVIESFDKTIDMLKEKSGAKSVELVGYSGGAAIAILVAAGRRDVVALRTVAGNLDTKALCAYHRVSQLDGSMNPLDVAEKVAHIPQRHFVGSRDKIVPFAIAEYFVKMEGDKDCKSITVVSGATHNDDWDRRWKGLLSIPCHNKPRSI